MGSSGYFRRTSDRLVEQLRARPERVMQVLFPTSNETVVDEEVRLEVEAWQPLHALLAGTTDFIQGGTPLGDIDVGDGPARSFTSAEVKRIAAKLATMDRSAVRARFDPATSGGWTLDALLGQLADLQEFVMLTAQSDAALIVYMR